MPRATQEDMVAHRLTALLARRDALVPHLVLVVVCWEGEACGAIEGDDHYPEIPAAQRVQQHMACTTSTAALCGFMQIVPGNAGCDLFL